MTEEYLTIHDLPDYWQRQIRRLRAENYGLRERLKPFEGRDTADLPASWTKKLIEIRRENAKYRTQRNEARAEVEALRAELEARSQ